MQLKKQPPHIVHVLGGARRSTPNKTEESLHANGEEEGREEGRQEDREEEDCEAEKEISLR
ncbi:MAG TPA: hypothetical protein VGG10_06570 [Rhizomicrobium sp.]